MQKRILIVVGITILFLGVGFQPAIANEISTNAVSDVDEDCFECQPVSRVDLLRVKLLLIRVEVLTNILIQRFGHISEVEEKCQEILDVIHKNREFDNLIICIILGILILLVDRLFQFMCNLVIIFPKLDDMMNIIGDWMFEFILFPIVTRFIELCLTP